MNITVLIGHPGPDGVEDARIKIDDLFEHLLAALSGPGTLCDHTGQGGDITPCLVHAGVPRPPDCLVG
eukprot:1084025-Heterocapsa_arctica.AAC.1